MLFPVKCHPLLKDKNNLIELRYMSVVNFPRSVTTFFIILTFSLNLINMPDN